MISLDELKQTLEERARTAPDGAKLLDVIVLTAGRRRRRRIMAVAATAVVVAVAMVIAAPAQLHRLARRAPAPASSASAPPQLTTPPPQPTTAPAYHRDLAQITVDLEANPRWAVRAYALDATTQYLLIRESQGGELPVIGVVVHDPGTFSPTQLRDATPVRVQGHAAQQVENLAMAAPIVSPASYTRFQASVIAWQDSVGAWVLVFSSTGASADLAAFAELVRLGPPRPISVPSPVSFTYIPPGLSLIFGTTPGPDGAFMVGFGDHESPNPAVPPIDGGQSLYPVLVQLVPRDSYTDYHAALLGSPTVVNGVKTWSSSHMEQVIIPPGGRVLIGQSASCSIFILAVDANRVSLADMQQMIAGAHLDNCQDVRSWTATVHG